MPVTSAHEGLSMESVSGSKAVEKLSKEVNDHLRVHMSFTQPAKARPRHCQPCVLRAHL